MQTAALLAILLLILTTDTHAKNKELEHYNNSSSGISFSYPHTLKPDKNSSTENPFCKVFRYGTPPSPAM